MSVSIFTQGELQLYTHSFYQAFENQSDEYILNILSNYKLSKVKDDLSITLLHLAAMFHRYNLIYHLSKHGCKLDAQTNDGSTPLLYAVIKYNNGYNSQATLNAFFDLGANVCLPDIRGQSPFSIIGANLSKFNQSVLIPLLRSSTSSKGFTMKKLEEADFSLRHAVFVRRIDLLIDFLRAGHDVNAADEQDGTTALHNAVRLGNFEIVKFLVENGADVNAKNVYGNTPINSATSDKILRKLLDAGTDNFQYCRAGHMQLWAPLKLGDSTMIKTILEYRFDLNKKDDYGYTMIHYAAQNFEDETAKLFELQEFDPNIKDGTIKAKTALHIAAKSENVEFVRMLLKKEADVNCEDFAGCTPLFDLVGNNLSDDSQCVEVLLAYGANISHVNCQGTSIIQRMVESLNLKIMKPILRHMAYLYVTGHRLLFTKQSLQSLMECEQANSHFNNYKNQFETMKKMVIGEPNITYFDILINPTSKVSGYIRSEKVQSNFKKNLKTLSSINRKILIKKFNRGSILLSKVRAAKKALGNLFQVEDRYAVRLVKLLMSQKFRTLKR